MKGTISIAARPTCIATLPSSTSATTAALRFGVEDNERHDMLLAAVRGKRLTYRRIGDGSLA
jgi:hypothetical protein